jgi:hypothetical protein
LRCTLPQLGRGRLQVLRVLLHLRARPCLIPRLIPLVRRLLPSLLQLHLRLLLQPRSRAPELRLLLLRLVPACRCGLRQHREPRLREHVLQRQRPGLRVRPAHPQHCNVTHVPVLLLRARGKRVLARRKACVRLVERHNNIVRAARRRVVLVVRPASVRVDRLHGSHNAPAAVAGRVVATIRDQ